MNKLTRKQNFTLALVTILTIGGLEAVALFQGIDGQAFMAVTGILGGGLGWFLKGTKDHPTKSN
jgi:hypothetical protein